MRLLLALVVLQAACVSSSIELVEDTGPRVDTGLDARGADARGADARVADAGPPPPHDAGCQLSAAPSPPAECYVGCDLVVPELDMVTCLYNCEGRPAECFTQCSPGDLCVVGFECCDGEVCDLIARNESGYDQLCFPDDVPPEYSAACIENECKLVDFARCEEDDSCIVVLSREEVCDGVAINAEHFSEYRDLLCDAHSECCDSSILEEAEGATCNEENFCEADF